MVISIVLQITGVMDEDVSELMVFDMAGKLVEKQKIRGKTATIIIEEYNAGNYFIQISNKFLLLKSRFVKQ